MALLSVPAVRLPVAAGAATYVVASTACYCMRRGSLHSLGALEVLRRHFDKEPTWPRGLRGHIGFAASFVVWLMLFQPIYPFLELALRPAGRCAFFYYCALCATHHPDPNDPHQHSPPD